MRSWCKYNKLRHMLTRTEERAEALSSPADLDKMFDTLMQYTAELRAIPGVDEASDVLGELAGLEAGYRAKRCFHMARGLAATGLPLRMSALSTTRCSLTSPPMQPFCRRSLQKAASARLGGLRCAGSSRTRAHAIQNARSSGCARYALSCSAADHSRRSSPAAATQREALAEQAVVTATAWWPSRRRAPSDAFVLCLRVR